MPRSARGHADDLTLCWLARWSRLRTDVTLVPNQGQEIGMEVDLSGHVALVAGATRGAGRALAVELARAGAFVYATGRSSRLSGPSDMDRPETIEETGDLVSSVGGRC